jgi:hypothetical protein
MFRDAKVGDRVWHIHHGWGEITEIDLEEEEIKRLEEEILRSEEEEIRKLEEEIRLQEEQDYTHQQVLLVDGQV